MKKTKLCPDCGKLILPISNRCGSCSQKGSLNRNYKDGSKSNDRYCLNCNKRISTASSGLCMDCYIKSIPRGKDNIHYIDGRSFLKLFKDKRYIEWKVAVILRDNHTCVLCGYSNKRRIGLHAHHIYPRRDHPELVFEVNNGITLCKNCHRKTYGKEYKYISTFLQIINGPNKNSVNSVNGENPNTEPSNIINIEGVTTRDAIKFSTSAGQPLQM